MTILQKCQHFYPLGINVLITALFVVFEQIGLNAKDALIMDIICAICAIFFSVEFITKYLNWNQVDISPFFFWTLIMKRIVIIGVSKSEFTLFLFGFLNGQYASKQEIGDQNRYCLKARSFIQGTIFLILIICNSSEIFEEFNIVSLIILILLAIFVQLNDHVNIQKTCKTPDQCMTDLKSTHIEVKKQTTLVQTRGKWDQFIENNDDWICRIDVNKYQYIDSIANSELNYSMRKQLQDSKVELSLLFNKMIVTSCQTSLQQSVQLWPEVNEQETFDNWLKTNYFAESSFGKLEIRKRMESKNKINFNEIPDDQSLYSPQNEQKLRDQVNEISDLSAIPHNLPDPMGSGSLQQMRTTTLNCHLNVKQAVDLNVIIQIMDEEGLDGNRKFYLIIVMRNNDKYIKTKQAQEKLEQQAQILFKHIGRMAADTGKLIQQINETRKYFAYPKDQDKSKLNNYLFLSFCDDQFIKSEKQISEQKIPPHHLTVPQPHSSIQRLTSSHSHNHDSQEEQCLYQKISIGQFQQQQEIQRQIEKSYYMAVMLEQINFNFYELFSHTKWKEDKFNLSTTFNAVKELFKNNPTLIKQSIFIVSEIVNEEFMIITADKQKIKQILINLINNSIESYEKQAENKNQKIIKIKAIGTKDTVSIEITDNAGGILDDQLKSRLSDCRFGLAACQRILHLICGDTKSLEIIHYMTNYSGQRGTKVQFFIPREAFISSQIDEYRQFDSLKVSNRVENIETQN